MRVVICILLFVIPSTLFALTGDKPIKLDELAITVAGQSREVAYTNKQAGYFYTETGAEHRSGWQGWHIMSTTMMDDYHIFAGGDPLSKNDVVRATVYPHQLQREYRNGAIETVTLLDSIDALVVELKNLRSSALRVLPSFNDARIATDFVLKWDDGVLCIARRRHPARTEKENYPVWVGMTAVPATSIMSWGEDSLSSPFGYSPARLTLRAWRNGATVIFVAADSQRAAVSLARNVAKHIPALIEKRKRRMERLVNRSYFRCDDRRYTQAVNWAKLSMDALVMDQLKKGIFAGLPWFDNYWGRDSYISLPGARLVTGDFADAKEVLRSFAGWQDTARSSPTFGRIPNLVTVNSIAYNTADGTPWFTISALDYIRSSGDTAFTREIYPAVRLAIESSLERWTDAHRFHIHGDAETWMDAVGGEGPWSPRGNRANDIQALWYRQLSAGAALASLAHDLPSANRWSLLADTVKANFNHFFVVRDSAVIDHLRPDGSADPQYRPNQLFTLDMIDNRAVAARIFTNITERLVYPYGVASLWQEDPEFHPYHHYEEAYVQDAAYHNGIVWVWLAGPWIDEATRFGLQDTAYRVTTAMTHQLLDRGAVGTLSELLDAVPRPGEPEPRISGAFSQAWSLAEFIRNTYRSYCGVKIDAPERRIVLRPRLPRAMGNVAMDVPLEGTMVRLRYTLQDGNGSVAAEIPQSISSCTVELQLPASGGETRSYEAQADGGNKLIFHLQGSDVRVENATAFLPLQQLGESMVLPATDFTGIHLAVPIIKPGLKSLTPVAHRLLTHAEAKRSSPNARMIYHATDPAGDDTGTGGYIYPQNPSLKPGSLDVREFTLSADSSSLYFSLRFSQLSNPGWHPEYGFQLTMAAVAIHTGDKAGSGSRLVGRNASYILDSADAYERIVYVGGGVRIEDDKGAVLAEYRPAAGDEVDPLGHIENQTVSFSLPVDLIGMPQTSWRYTVLVGAQDDHGGAGIGEFRKVGRDAGEWVGGGKIRPSDPNIYDVILPPRR